MILTRRWIRVTFTIIIWRLLVEYYGCSGKYRQFATVFCEILLILLIFKISLTEKCFLKLCLGINAEQFDVPIVMLNYNLCFILCCASNYRTIIYAVFGIMNKTCSTKPSCLPFLIGCFFILSPCYYLQFLNTQGKDGSQGPSGSGGVKGDKVNLWASLSILLPT